MSRRGAHSQCPNQQTTGRQLSRCRYWPGNQRMSLFRHLSDVSFSSGYVESHILGLLTAINTNLQPQIMHLLGCSIDSVRKLVGVWNYATCGGITVILDRPAVVDLKRKFRGGIFRAYCWRASLLLTYSYPSLLRPDETSSLAAVIILVSLISQPNAFHEFQPSAGSLPCQITRTWVNTVQNLGGRYKSKTYDIVWSFYGACALKRQQQSCCNRSAVNHFFRHKKQDP